jgi:type I restriction enzyme S subunit
MSEEATLNEFINTSDNESSKSEERESRFWGEIPSDWNLIDGSGIYEVNPNPDPIQQPNTYIEMDALNTELPFPDYFGERNASEYSGKTFTQGDTLFARITPCTENGKAALVPEMETEVGIGSTEFAVLSPKSDIIHPWLLYYLNKSHPVHNYAVSRMRGSTGRQRVPFNMFRKELDFPLPPLSEQRKIATVLHTVDQAIQKTEAVIEQVERLEKGTIQSLLSDGIRNAVEKKDTPIGEVPEHWDVRQVRDLTNVTVGYVQNIDGHFNNSDDGIRLYRTKDISSRGLQVQDESYVTQEFHADNKGSQLTAGDLIVARHGDSGQAAVIPESTPEAHCQNAVIVRSSNEFVSKFLEYLFNYEVTRQRLLAWKAGSVQKVVSTTAVQNFRIPLPSIEEQNEIVEKLSSVNDRLENEDVYLQTLHTLKRGLMQDLLSGEVRTTDVDIDIPQEVAKYA